MVQYTQLTSMTAPGASRTSRRDRCWTRGQTVLLLAETKTTPCPAHPVNILSLILQITVN